MPTFLAVFLLLLGILLIVALLIRVAMLSSQVQQLQNFVGQTATFDDMTKFVINHLNTVTSAAPHPPENVFEQRPS